MGIASRVRAVMAAVVLVIGALWQGADIIGRLQTVSNAVATIQKPDISTQFVAWLIETPPWAPLVVILAALAVLIIPWDGVHTWWRNRATGTVEQRESALVTAAPADNERVLQSQREQIERLSRERDNLQLEVAARAQQLDTAKQQRDAAQQQRDAAQQQRGEALDQLNAVQHQLAEAPDRATMDKVLRERDLARSAEAAAKSELFAKEIEKLIPPPESFAGTALSILQPNPLREQVDQLTRQLDSACSEIASLKASHSLLTEIESWLDFRFESRPPKPSTTGSAENHVMQALPFGRHEAETAATFIEKYASRLSDAYNAAVLKGRARDSDIDAEIAAGVQGAEGIRRYVEYVRYLETGARKP